MLPHLLQHPPPFDPARSSLPGARREIPDLESRRLRLTPPSSALRACVVVPARNEEARVASLIASLAAQHDGRGNLLEADSFEVLLLLNNCSDGTASVARERQREYPWLRLHVIEVSFAAPEAHVGKARQLLFDTAFHRFQLLRGQAGLILTTDADSRPAPDWITQSAAEIAQGVDAVGGRILLEPEEWAALPLGVRKFFLLDIGYRRALEEMRSLFAPQRHDPFPRHHQHFGGSFAVTASAYARASGMPLRSFHEDIGLYQAIIDSGGRVRHSEAVRVHTSARMVGRAQGGLADAIGWWNDQVREAAPVLVESAAAAEARLLALGRWCVENPEQAPPVALTTTPYEPPARQAADIQATLSVLRERLEFLRPLPLAARLFQPQVPGPDRTSRPRLGA